MCFPNCISESTGGSTSGTRTEERWEVGAEVEGMVDRERVARLQTPQIDDQLLL